jgi:hypothetical protein
VDEAPGAIYANHGQIVAVPNARVATAYPDERRVTLEREAIDLPGAITGLWLALVCTSSGKHSRARWAADPESLGHQLRHTQDDSHDQSRIVIGED